MRPGKASRSTVVVLALGTVLAFRPAAQQPPAPVIAIRAGTLIDGNGGAAGGLEARIGTVAAGKQAALVAVRGDPLADITLLERLDFVMKSGTVFKQDGRVQGRSAAGVP